jgi:hypothetical protein
MRTAWKLAWGCLVLGACTRESRIEQTVLPQPFRPLEGIAPGISVSRLQHRRPVAQFAPYVGYEERIGPVTYRYYVEGTESRQVGDGNTARVNAIEAVVKRATPEEARAAWASAFRDYRARARGNPECYLIDGTLANNGPAALWKTGSNYIVLRAATGRATRGAARASSPLVIWRVGNGPLPPVLTTTEAKSVDCVTLTGGTATS